MKHGREYIDQITQKSKCLSDSLKFQVDSFYNHLIGNMSEDFDFSDVVPVKLNEEEPQLCQILYSDEYKKCMGILLALMKQREYSQRALFATEQGLSLVASHYTLWVYRFDIVSNMDHDLIEELEWCEQIAIDNEKNYQIWNYRQLIIQKIQSMEEYKTRFSPQREYPLIGYMLEMDAKNHHVWSYRKWLVETFSLHFDEKEIAFVEKCIDDDLCNNSAWSHRFFIKFGHKNPTAPEIIEFEINYTKRRIKEAPSNTSSWNYLLGIHRRFQIPFSKLDDFCRTFFSDRKVESLYSESLAVKSIQALEVLASIHEEAGENEHAVKLYELLANKFDSTRVNYWKYKISRVISL